MQARISKRHEFLPTKNNWQQVWCSDQSSSSIYVNNSVPNWLNNLGCNEKIDHTTCQEKRPHPGVYTRILRSFNNPFVSQTGHQKMFNLVTDGSQSKIRFVDSCKPWNSLICFFEQWTDATSLLRGWMDGKLVVECFFFFFFFRECLLRRWWKTLWMLCTFFWWFVFLVVSEKVNIQHQKFNFWRNQPNYCHKDNHLNPNLQCPWVPAVCVFFGVYVLNVY